MVRCGAETGGGGRVSGRGGTGDLMISFPPRFEPHRHRVTRLSTPPNPRPRAATRPPHPRPSTCPQSASVSDRTSALWLVSAGVRVIGWVAAAGWRGHRDVLYTPLRAPLGHRTGPTGPSCKNRERRLPTTGKTVLTHQTRVFGEQNRLRKALDKTGPAIYRFGLVFTIHKIRSRCHDTGLHSIWLGCLSKRRLRPASPPPSRPSASQHGSKQPPHLRGGS